MDGMSQFFGPSAHRERSSEAFCAFHRSTSFAVRMLQDAAKAFLAADHLECWNVFRSVGLGGQWNIANSLMSALFMMMSDVLVDQEVEMGFANRHKMVEALSLDGSDPAFRVCVHVGTSDGDALNFHVRFVEGGVERGAVLGIVVANHDRAVGHALLSEALDERLCLEVGPLGRRVRGRGRDEHAARADMEPDEDEIVPPTGPGKHGLGEEIALPQRGGMDADEFGPSFLAAFATGIEAILAHHVDDELARDLVRSEHAQLAENARVAPAGAQGNVQNELAQIERLWGTSSCSLFPLRLVAAQPTAESAVADDGDQMLERRANPFPILDQSVAFTRSERDSLGQFAAKNPVFFFEVLDMPGEFFIRGAGEKQKQRLKERTHGRFQIRANGMKAPGLYTSMPEKSHARRHGFVSSSRQQNGIGSAGICLNSFGQ
jgi:hypothetical protein